jgi:hypothetical protein
LRERERGIKVRFFFFKFHSYTLQRRYISQCSPK